jgi:hypothetical protein
MGVGAHLDQATEPEGEEFGEVRALHALDLTVAVSTGSFDAGPRGPYGARPRPLPARSTEAERAAHAEFVLGAVKSELWKSWL